MNVNEIREKSRSVIGPYCKSCPECKGKLVRIKSLDQALKEQEQ